MNPRRSIVQIRLRGARRRAERVFKSYDNPGNVVACADVARTVDCCKQCFLF